MNTHTNNPQGGAERDPGNIHSSSEAAHAEFKMIMDEAEAARTSKEDIFAKLLAWGVHPEIVFRLERIWEYTKRVGERIIHVGQLVLAKIIEFIEANPQMLIGAALGAAIGILASGIPVLGPLLAPISVLLGAGFGAIVGHDLDREDKGLPARYGGPIRQTIQSFLEIAGEFFRLFIELLNLVISQGTPQKSR